MYPGPYIIMYIAQCGKSCWMDLIIDLFKITVLGRLSY
jgi:hypothetical protein